jgi:hypothetical protein
MSFMPRGSAAMRTSLAASSRAAPLRVAILALIELVMTRLDGGLG